MTIQRWFITALILSSYGASADDCRPFLGTFHCVVRRGDPAPEFELSLNTQTLNGVTTYTMSDPSGQRNIIADEQTRSLEMQNGTGQYRARCERGVLIVEIRNPKGETYVDQFRIENKALVRVRLAKQGPSVLSCRPTHGTWRYYER